MILLLLKLLAAHFIGDFVLQPKKWVVHKEKHKVKSKYLYAHIGVHAMLLLLFLGFKHTWTVVFIGVTHFLIDWGKLAFSTPKNSRVLFLVDQLAHLLILILAYYIIEPFSISWSNYFDVQFYLLLLFIVLATFVSAILIKMFLTPYINLLNLDEGKTDQSTEGEPLPNAGLYIGILERLFVFGFIIANQWAAIGLLIAAKSVFRFGDLNKGNNRKLTEYVLIGTLLSFGLAILCGLGYTYLIVQLS
ncbi:hypothetical protein BUL40_13405 [Croceivirga radicis]|uniref:DUF3307 domain-containing protein n=1 Tax=Croceivirga radicis TaxID=1929488 RepID=A0A1V6LNY2_9FLAO|nr:DUF3307 domain-containing protein [Croceivirga radicis]OQD41848.1 hypothetical protein BUL40_13405 [Croceivirga radicis]